MKVREGLAYAIILGLILVIGLQVSGKREEFPLSRGTPTDAIRQQGMCQIKGYLPDPACTPGEINPDVVQTQIQDTTHATICKRGWTETIRPAVSSTENLKREQIAQYGYTDTNPKHYAEDHLVPLEVGGNPIDPRNLWPEPIADAQRKDSVESAVHEAVCYGSMTLSQGQMIFLNREWHQYYK